jgi:hypothetical protein
MISSRSSCAQQPAAAEATTIYRHGFMSTSKLAIEALRKQIQKIAFDANLFNKGLADYPYAKNCSEKRKELLKAIEELESRS